MLGFRSNVHHRDGAGPPSQALAIKTAGVFDVDWRAYVAWGRPRLHADFGEHKGSVVIRRPHIEPRRPLLVLRRATGASTWPLPIHMMLQAAKARKQFTLHTPEPITNSNDLI